MTVLRLNNAAKTFGGRAPLTLWETLQGMPPPRCFDALMPQTLQ